MEKETIVERKETTIMGKATTFYHLGLVMKLVRKLVRHEADYGANSSRQL